MKAIDRAVGYLNIKPRTEYQVRKYLKEKGYDDAETHEAVAQLLEYRYIDDFSYASMYFELGFEKGRGIGRIKRELAEKGVKREVIEEAFENLENVPDQYEEALKIGRAVADSDSGGDRYKLQAKIARRLASRGFSGDIAYKVAREVTK